MKRIGVVGTLVWDTIRHPANRSAVAVEQWGGIAYSLSAFAAVRDSRWTIVPILKLGADLEGEALEFLRRLPGLDLRTGIVRTNAPTNRVELHYPTDREGVPSGERTERLTGGVPGWKWRELEPRLAKTDALYVNFISGYEMDLATAESLRQLPIPLYADLHSLFLGAPGEGARVPRPLPHWRRWVGAFDAVQVNEAELNLTGRESASDPERLIDTARAGPALALVTRGSRGASYARRPERGDPDDWPDTRSLPPSAPADIEHATVPPASGPLAGDPTGCGDVWGSVTFSCLLHGLSPEQAIARANVAAAAKIHQPHTTALREAISAAVPVR